jgi:hypothetical protein
MFEVRAARRVAALCVLGSALLLVPAAAAAPTTKFVSKFYGYSMVCSDGNVIGITALHAQHGYFIFVISPTSSSSASNRSAFEAARQSFRFLDS